MKRLSIIILVAVTIMVMATPILALSDYEKGYNDGRLQGQEDSNFASQFIEGFFEAITGFLEPFLNIGIGAMTLRSILAVAFVGIFFVFILKLRG